MPMMTKNRISTSLVLFLTTIAIASGASAAEQKAPINHEEQYEACLRLVESRPDSAFEAALSWASQGGGYAAEHCATQALYALKIYDAAATRLEKLAQDMKSNDLLLKSQLLHQAGRAWYSHGDLDRAFAVQSTAITIYPDGTDYYIDRAEILAEQGRFDEALIDLEVAHSLEPERDDVLVLRASAKRFLGNDADAMTDAEKALSLNPDNMEALLERGILRRLKGDDAGAREDWLRIVNKALGTPAADAAQLNLEKLDVTVN
ncbi:tetratricopeptide repeat protein [Kiloniella laminariae]|uniref:tetratricopeptide repeat protein n=1 Tax=Kiloniella laminariae TaxID=454162 RepID=UPI00039E58BF|nr:tetratricopeptide repeat protein [Kiloniella laminariae]